MKRRVFVTGGAHGIGKGIVEAFARQGEEVVFCDLDPVLGAQTVAETGARFCQLDVTDAVSLERCMRELFETWGDIDEQKLRNLNALFYDSERRADRRSLRQQVERYETAVREAIENQQRSVIRKQEAEDIRQKAKQFQKELDITK